MKKYLGATLLLFVFHICHAQNVGIGTTSPKARLHVADSAVLFTGPASLSNLLPPPISGPGTRMLWYAQKAAFRVGAVNNSAWDKDSIGQYSFASGFNTKALAPYATSIGVSTAARGIAATSMGINTNASGDYSTSMGTGTKAKSNSSLAIGSYNDSTAGSNERLFEIGNGTADNARSNALTVLSNGNVGIGTNNPGSGLTGPAARISISTTGMQLAGTAMSNALRINAGTLGQVAGNEVNIASLGFFGGNNISLGIRGYRHTAGSDWTSTSVLLGYDVDNTVRAAGNNGFIALGANGNLGIGTTSPVARLHVADSAVVFTGPLQVPDDTNYPPPVSGIGARLMWYPQKGAFRVGYVYDGAWDKDNIGIYSFASGFSTKATGYAATSIGFETRANGRQSTSMGFQTEANGDKSLSIGMQTTANGFASTSMGLGTISNGALSTSMGWTTNATGYGSTSMGYFTKAKGDYSMSMGSETIAESESSLVIGKFNDNSNTNRLFEIGNGTADNARSNALTVLTNGNLGIGNIDPKRKLSFAAEIGEKILLYPGANGEVGIGVYGNELRLHADNPGAKVSFGTQDNNGVFTEVGKFEKNGAYGLSVFGSIWANGITYASDARFKKNIEPLNNSLDKILQLEGVSYQMKADEFPGQQFDAAQQVGLLAQDVEKIVPEVVSTSADGYKAIDYAKLVPLLIESIKAQQAQIESLQKKIDTLKLK